jgi:L-fucose isomerase-like protein
MHKVKLGVLCLARTTFDYQAALELYRQRQAELTRDQTVDWTFIEGLVIEPEEAEGAARTLVSAQVDGVVVISGTFHLGHLALIIDQIVRRPILLWGWTELPYDGGKIRLNSVCGVNLNASNLYKSGNDTYHACFGDLDTNWLQALKVKATLAKAHLGLFGFRAHGFFNLAFDELRTYRETGLLLDHYELTDLWQASGTPEQLAQQTEEVRLTFDCSGVTDRQVELVARLCLSAERFLSEQKLDAAAVRCWPEFAGTYGISPCAMMSLLQSQGRVLACEGDVEGAITMLACQALGAATPFLADLSQVNFEEDFALMWHCGVAPASLWDGRCVRSLDTYFAGGKGVTADFVLREGEINVVRFDSARGRTRMFLAAGQALPMEKQLKGTYGKVRFSCSVRELVQQVVDHGVAHHVAYVYGDYRPSLRLLAKLMNWDVIEC